MPSSAERPRTLLVTRPQPQADAWVVQLAALGVAARALPLLSIDDAPDRDAVAGAWRELPRRDLAMFVSPNAALRFFAMRPSGSAWPAATLAAGTGPGTRRALLDAGVPPALVVAPPDGAERFDSEALWEVLGPTRVWAGAEALIVRGDGGREWLADALRAAGASVSFVAAYRRGAPSAHDPMRDALLREVDAHPDAFAWHFSSSQALGHLDAMVRAAAGPPGAGPLSPEPAPPADASPARYLSVPAIATHPRIAQAARDAGFADVRLVAPTAPAAADALRGLR